MVFIPLASLVVYFMLFIKISLYRMSYGDSIQKAVIYSFFNILRKFPTGFGFFKYFLQSKKQKKKPDPHIAKHKDS